MTTRNMPSPLTTSFCCGAQNLVLLAGTIAITTALSACSEPTAEEQLADARKRLLESTIEGTADTGFYPLCSRWDDHEPGDCYNLHNMGPRDHTRRQHSVSNIETEAEGRPLTIMELDSASIFFNNITYTPAGSLVAVGGPALQIAKADNESARTWDVQSFSRFGDSFRDVAFRDSAHGIATGNSSVIYRTLDGGEHWYVYNETYNSSNRDLPSQLKLEGEAYAVDYANSSTAVVGGNVHMLRTTDGGQHWFPTGPDLGREAIQEIAFVDESTGWAVGSAGQVFRTQDAGDSWEPVEIADDDTYLLGLDFVGQHGCMAGSWKVWCTDNGGESWQESVIEQPAIEKYNRPFYDITRLRLEDEQNGWFITHYGWIYETHDGGASWQPWTKVPQAAEGAVHGMELWGMTVGDQKVWAVGRGSFESPASQREDGGQTYSISSSAIILSWPRANPDQPR